MEISEARKNDVVILALNGRLDAGNAGTLEQKLLGLIGSGETRFVVDCARLDYISSAGLRVLLVVAKRLKASSGTIALAALNEQIQEIFDIAGFSSIFQIFPTQDAAVAAAQ